MPKRKLRRSWTPEQVKILKTKAKKVSAVKIARMLKRSEGATRQKAFTLGLSMNSRDYGV